MHPLAPPSWDTLRRAAAAALRERRFDDAERWHTASLHLAEAGGASDPRLLASLRDLIDLHGQHLAQLQHAASPAGDDPAGREDRRARAILADRIRRRRRAAAARLVAALETARPLGDPALVDALLQLAELSWDVNEMDALVPLERALALRERALGPHHPATLALVRRLAGWHTTLGDFAAAEPHWRRVLADVDRQAAGRGGNVEDRRGLLFELGKAYNALGRHAEAEATWRAWLALPAPTIPHDPTGYLRALTSLDPLYGAARACAAQGRWAAAEPLFRRAVAAHRRCPDDPIYERAGADWLGLDAGLRDLARTLRALGRDDEAAGYYGAALAARRGARPPWAERDLPPLLREYGATLRALDRVDEAVAAEARAATVQRAVDAHRTEVRAQAMRRGARPRGDQPPLAPA